MVARCARSAAFAHRPPDCLAIPEILRPLARNPGPPNASHQAEGPFSAPGTAFIHTKGCFVSRPWPCAGWPFPITAVRSAGPTDRQRSHSASKPRARWEKERLSRRPRNYPAPCWTARRLLYPAPEKSISDDTRLAGSSARLPRASKVEGAPTVRYFRCDLRACDSVPPRIQHPSPPDREKPRSAPWADEKSARLPHAGYPPIRIVRATSPDLSGMNRTETFLP